MAKGDKEMATKADIREAVDAILAGLDEIVKKINVRFDKIEAGQLALKRHVSDLKYDTPSQKEFDDLKRRVNRYHPAD